MLLDFHHHGKLVRGTNLFFVVLIPKKDIASGINDYRPISLIGGIYKILSKALDNCLSRSSIALSQRIRAPLSVRDKFLIVFLNEAIDEAKKKRIKRMFFKIDFAKAYNSVDWRFLVLMMEFWL